jgi:hypothetical protein
MGKISRTIACMEMSSICRIFIENCQEENPLEIHGSAWNNINTLMPKIHVENI